jgi:hypothetical protein
MATRSPPSTFASRAQWWSVGHHLKEDQATWSVEFWRLSQAFLLFALYLPKHHILNDDDFNLRPATLIF